MTTRDDINRLAEVLEIFGPEAERWPAAERDRLEALVGREEAAGKLVVEARALAAVMAHAPAGAASAELKARILAAASPEAQGAPIIVRAPESPLRRLFGSGWSFGPAWPSAAVMAASLACGIYLGASGLAQPVFDDAFTMASLDSGVEDAEDLFKEDDESNLGEESML